IARLARRTSGAMPAYIGPKSMRDPPPSARAWSISCGWTSTSPEPRMVTVPAGAAELAPASPDGADVPPVAEDGAAAPLVGCVVDGGGGDGSPLLVHAASSSPAPAVASTAL